MGKQSRSSGNFGCNLSCFFFSWLELARWFPARRGWCEGGLWLCPARARATWAGGGPQWCRRLVQGWGRFICERDGGVLTPLFLPRAFTKLIFGKAKAKATWVSEAAPGQIAPSACRTPELCPSPFQQSPLLQQGPGPAVPNPHCPLLWGQEGHPATNTGHP